MAFPLGKDEWWLCNEHGCGKADRASALESRIWIHSWLLDLRTDFRKMSLLKDLVRSDILAVPFNLPQEAFVRRIEELFISGKLHVHRKRREVRSGSGADQPNVAFPLADRQPRIASGPAPIVDVPIFASNLKMAAQTAALVTAAASGIPFCQECTSN